MSFVKSAKRTSRIKSRQITVAIVDEHQIIREGVASLLGACPGIVFVGGARDAVSAQMLVANERPDILLCDLCIPGSVGTDLVRQLRSTYPETKIIVLTMHVSTLVMHKMLGAGAAAFVCKRDDIEELIAIIRHVASGGAPIYSHSMKMECEKGHQNSLVQLSPKEREVLRGIASGYSSSKIGTRLAISPITVNTYRSRLMKKFGVKSCSALLWLAIESDIVSVFLSQTSAEDV